MGDLADTVSEAVERSQSESGASAGSGGSNLNTLVAISVAITATFTALCNVKDGNIVQAMQQAQASGVDAWAYYQAKGTKLNIVEAAIDNLRVQRDLSPPATPEARALLDRTLADYAQKVKHYEDEKAEIKRTAEGFQKEYDRLNVHDDQFDMAEATMSIAIALFGITALTQKRKLLYAAWGFAGIGAVLGLAGFFGLSLHPDFLAKILS
jgi:Domain of unknown function (DUF4337)